MFCLVTLLCSSPVCARDSSSQWIISLEPGSAIGRQARTEQIDWLSRHLRLETRLIRRMSGNALVLEIFHTKVPPSQLADRLASIPGVAGAVRDAPARLMQYRSTPDSANHHPESILVNAARPGQWQLAAPHQHTAAIDTPRAWQIARGSTSTVIAVIDTGVDYTHPDLNNRLLPGYDFVSELARSNDGDGRDADATDPGNAVEAIDKAHFNAMGIDCDIAASTWHGTAMASIIAANNDDHIGMNGIDWFTHILPVRAIGVCGGHRSDLLDAIRWAAGVKDAALPANPTPARIINLSLGIDDLCTDADQSAINDAVEAGAIIVAAVGNHGRHTDTHPSSPSHCRGVIGVMAVDKQGRRAHYSNFGRDADIGAPGGDPGSPGFGITVAANAGAHEPVLAFTYRQATGTSAAAPHVSGVLGLMLAANPTLDNTQLQALLLDNTRAFPVDEHMGCDEQDCGAGLLDAFGAVHAALNHDGSSLDDSPSLAAAQSVPVLVGKGQAGVLLFPVLALLLLIRYITAASCPFAFALRASRELP